MDIIVTQSFSDTLVDHDIVEDNFPYRYILWLFLLNNFWTFILTLIPVIATVGPNNYYAGHHDWYTGNDVIRFIEPIGGLPINFLVFYKSGIFRSVPFSQNDVAVIALFFLGAAIYGQGAGFHSAANMFKNSLETIYTDDDRYEDLYYYMRTVWEHDVAHYLYAVGLTIMYACQAYVYRHKKVSSLGMTRSGKALLLLTSLIYALLVAGVAIEFPSGTIVGIIYTVLYGIGIIGGYLYYLYKYEKDTNIWQLGQRPILHHFFLGSIWALIIIIAWISKFGFKNRSEAGQ